MRHYYNDNDPKACAWLRELIAAGELPPGDVDERSITEIKADDLEKYDQCHFFAGIGGWPLALRWAGLENATGIWTGSCPCQPLSCAGKRQGHADERHLWPAFHALIAKCRPATVFGEQVASKDGREWFAGVRLDLEDLGYACGGADLCAAGVGAPHRRQRLYWVADTQHDGHDRQGRNETEQGGNRENNRLFIGGGGELCSSGSKKTMPTIRRGTRARRSATCRLWQAGAAQQQRMAEGEGCRRDRTTREFR
jgi:DNA (cytosine-5)-methyltransferase 1